MKTTAKDFFLYLGILIGLYVSSISFIVLLFQIINKYFSLPGDMMYGLEGTIRSSLAALIIFFPAFIYITFIVNKDLKAFPEKKDIWVRRWLIFLTLFVSGLAIAVDLVTLVYRFLGAEDLTTRFILKVLVVLAVAVTIFRYCLSDLKRDPAIISKKTKISIYAISVIVIIAAVGGMMTIGSPAKQRAVRMDKQRISDLMNIQSQIVYTQWQIKGEVPASLDALKDPISSFIIPTDPETKQNYEYRRLSANSFELCATFKTESTTEQDMNIAYKYGAENENWKHGMGRFCFQRPIDKDTYPVQRGMPTKFLD
ncbi:MAG: DUF5671 domain-containing protein [Candidatus Paceibacterota bacterium]|jgi:hypothetical protein